MATLQSVLSFDGKDDYIALPPMMINYNRGFTIEAWVRYNAFQSWSRIIDWGNGANNQNIVFANRQTTKQLALNIRATSKPEKEVSVDTLEGGKWLHVAGTIDEFGMGKLYKNGQLLQSGQLYPPDILNINRTVNYIARSNWSGDQHFNGQLTEIRLWNIPRSQEQLQKQMNRRLVGNESGLAAYWPLNEGSGNTVNDKTSNKFNGTIISASWTQESLDLDPPTKACKLKNPTSGLLADVVGGQAIAGTRVWGYSSNDSVAQKWSITPEGVIKSQLGDFALDLQGYDVVINPINGAATQKWEITPTGVIKNKSNNYALVLSQGTNNNPIALAFPIDESNPKANEKWEVVNI